LSIECLVWEFLFTVASLGLMSVELLNLLQFNLLLELVQEESKESTLNDILCFRNTGAANVPLLVQDADIVAPEGEDVDGVQFLALIA